MVSYDFVQRIWQGMPHEYCDVDVVSVATLLWHAMKPAGNCRDMFQQSAKWVHSKRRGSEKSTFLASFWAGGGILSAAPVL